MSAIEAYAGLDISSGSERFEALLKLADDEAGGRLIGLTGAKQAFDARQPGWLTPAMSSWYMVNIAGSRVAAITEIANGFREDQSLEGNAKSIYLEAERDRVRTKGTKAAIAETERFLHANKELIEQHDQRRQEYNTLKARMGREPVRTKVWLYVIILFALVLLEAFINFESFLRVPYITSPFLATGATMAVALGIAFAAHFHGTVVRQWHFLFSPQEADRQGHQARFKDALRRLAIGSLLLSLALLMVGGSRYYYLRDYILQAQILGTSAPSMLGGIVFMLFGNMVAYVVGLSVAYGMHDPNPLYAECDRELRRTTKKLELIKRKRLLEQETLRQGMDNELAECRKQDAAAQGPRYHELRQLSGIIESKDQEVLGVFAAYRARLVQALRLRADAKVFRFPDGAFEELLPTNPDRLLTPEEYASVPLALGYMVGEQ